MTDKLKQSLAKVVISQNSQGLFLLQVWSHDHGSLEGMGPEVINVHQAGRQQSGFHATIDNQHGRFHYVANYKLGVLVIEAFNQLNDDLQSPPFMEREFFSRQTIQPVKAAKAPTVDAKTKTR